MKKQVAVIAVKTALPALLGAFGMAVAMGFPEHFAAFCGKGVF